MTQVELKQSIILRKYGYPPDMEALATELVLEQAKVFTEFEVSTQH